MGRRTHLLNLSLDEDSKLPEIFDAYVLVTALSYNGSKRITKSLVFEKVVQYVIQQFPNGLPAELIDTNNQLTEEMKKKFLSRVLGSLNE